MDPGDDRQRQGDDRLHQAAALGEDPLQRRPVRAAQLFQVVAGAKTFAGARDHHGTQAGVTGDGGQGLLEGAHQVAGERVVLPRAIEGQRHDASVVLAAQQKRFGLKIGFLGLGF